jgi:HipA-like protein
MKKSHLWVGTLTREGADYVFRYTDAFRDRTELPPIANFPDKERWEYRSTTLFPFFAARLPSIERPEVAQIISEHGLDPADVMQLLANLGRKTITSPYELVVARGSLMLIPGLLG